MRRAVCADALQQPGAHALCAGMTLASERGHARQAVPPRGCGDARIQACKSLHVPLLTRLLRAACARGHARA
eukprot:2224600-Alexandrium_andersonii.AAC.1